MPYADRDEKNRKQRERVARRKTEWVGGRGCAECGGVDRLELDHVNPSEKVSHRLWSWRESRREAELSKCRLLCFGCHLEKSRRENSEAHIGAGNGRARLSVEDVLAIRAEIAQGVNRVEVMRKYRIAATTLSGIVRGTRWKHI